MLFSVIISYASTSDESNPVSCSGTSSTINSDFDDSYNSSDGKAYTGPVTMSWAKVRKVQNVLIHVNVLMDEHFSIERLEMVD